MSPAGVRIQEGDKARIIKAQHKRCGRKIPPASPLISVLEVLEVGEDRATSLVLEQEQRVSHPEVEDTGQSSLQPQIKVMHLAGDEAQTKATVGAEGMKHVKRALAP